MICVTGICSFSLICCIWYWWCLLFIAIVIVWYMTTSTTTATAVAKWEVSITACSPLIWPFADKTPASYDRIFFLNLIKFDKFNEFHEFIVVVVVVFVYVFVIFVIPWIIESLWIAAWVIGFAAIVPCTNFIAFNFTWIKTGDEIFIAWWPRSTCLSRYSKVAPSVFAFYFDLSYIKK